MDKIRIDVLLVERGLCETREKAKRLIMAGLVFSETERIDKPGIKVDADLPVHIKGSDMPYVGRGGLKLAHALNVFDADPKDKTVVDVGSSTGGFTDCALQQGAALSYAIDVGYNQLAWKLRQDERVEVMERTNFRYVDESHFSRGLPNFATIDVSFISLKLIFPVLKTILQQGSDVIALIKPQFEAGRDQVGKGIIHDPRIHAAIIEQIWSFVESEGFVGIDVHYSPITGSKGNIEYLLYATWEKNDEIVTNKKERIDAIVKEAHETLQK